MRLCTISDRTNRAWAVLVLVAVLFRALVPMGFMPVFDKSSGELEITMCSAAAGHETVVYKAPTHGPEKPASKDQSCPYAMTAAPVVPAAPSLVAASAVYEHEYVLAAMLPIGGSAPWSPHAPPTGPPTLT
jgi:hypothetical protein